MQGIDYPHIVVECSGVEPNPRITSVRRGTKTALGGGSVMDAAKVMAAGALYDGDPGDMIHHGQPKPYVPTKALPIIMVPTLAATGSEMNCSAVISNEETTEKPFVDAPCLYPAVALVDPELTVTVPIDQTAYGVCDIITHVTETYLNLDCALAGIDRFEESLRSIGCPTRLSELEIGAKLIPKYADENLRIIHDANGMLPARPAMSKGDIEAVLRAAL